MARLPDEAIQRIKTEVSLLRLVESQGYEIKRQGKDYAISCPFHEGDDTPSLIISPGSNLFHCFGCNAAGSVLDWVMKTRGVSFRHAAEILQEDVSLIAPSRPRAAQAGNRSVKKVLAPLLSSDDNAQALLTQVMDYYRETLTQSPEALAYLESRGLNHRELMERFKLGFANRTLGYRLPRKETQEGAALRGELQRLGIYRESGHEHFNGSLVVPVIDAQGHITEMYGRKITKGLRSGTPKHLYLPGPHRGVWNADGLAGGEEVIVCEALIDAMTFWVHGYRNVTASYGTGGWTVEHLALFKQLNIRRVLIAYDRDEAGNRAAEQLAKTLMAEGFDCYRVLFPKGMDANQYASQVQPAEKSLGVVIRSAEWLGEGKEPDRSCASLRSWPTAHPEHKRLLDIETQTGQPEAKTNREQPAGKQATIPEPASSLAAVPVATDTSPSATQPTLPPITMSPVLEPAESAKPESRLNAEVTDQEVMLTLGSRRYRVRGLEKNKHYDVLKVNVLANNAHGLHVDTFDLYHAKQRQQFIRLAAIELAVQESTVKNDMGRVLLKLEELQAQRLEAEQETDTNIPLSEQEQQEALALLRDPDVLNRILLDFERCGVVGEETNKLVGYLAAGSRKLERPLAVMIQSTSAAGKSSLMEAVLNLMPETERVQFSAMTGQSLFYMGETNLKHKILAIAEEEGASQASYALKLLQSEGEITIASTGKDDTTGNLVTREYKVEGPVMLFLTTTAIDIDEELLNRCVVLTVNESREQTKLIHAAQRQRRTLAGLQSKLEKDHLITLHRNAQKLLKPLAVINPYADRLTFLDDKTRTRRDHEKYLTLIDSIALLHQYQREVKPIHNGDKMLDYIEVQLSDIETANRLAHEVLGRTLDELAPQTRKLLALIQRMVGEACARERVEQKDYRFSRRDIRAYTSWSDNQLKVHCRRLEELEYLLVHRGSRGKNLVYELLFDGGADNGQAHLMGLIEVETLNGLHYDDEKLGATAQKLEPERKKLGPSCPQVGAKLGASCPGENEKTPGKTGSNAIQPDNDEKSTSEVKKITRADDRTEPSALAASPL